MDIFNDQSKRLRVTVKNPAALSVDVRATPYLLDAAGVVQGEGATIEGTIPAGATVALSDWTMWFVGYVGKLTPLVLIKDPATGTELARASGEVANVYVRAVEIIGITWI